MDADEAGDERCGLGVGAFSFKLFNVNCDLWEVLIIDHGSCST